MTIIVMFIWSSWYDYMPVWRVSLLARVSSARSSLARFTKKRSQFGAFKFGAMSVWRVPFCRVSKCCAYVCQVCTFLSAKECCLRQFGAYYFGVYLFCAFSFLGSIVCLISLLILSTCHRGYTIATKHVYRTCP